MNAWKRYIVSRGEGADQMGLTMHDPKQETEFCIEEALAVLSQAREYVTGTADDIIQEMLEEAKYWITEALDNFEPRVGD
jgi:hypothetical protein